jgi:hypothetical protein
MTDADSIWESKLSKLQDLDDQLDQERETNWETRRIISALALRISAIEAPSESPEASETVEEEPESAELRSSTGDPQTTRVETEERRGFWSRLFGGP